MGKIISVEVKGGKEAAKAIEVKASLIKGDAQKNLAEAGFFLQGEVKLSIAGQRSEPTSVDTGRFLNSVDMNADQDSVIVSTDVPYAKFLEYGTSKLAARMHFRNSLARSKDKVVEIVKGK